MILSYHPCFEGDRNLLCAGRRPGEEDLYEISRADAVILPQGAPRELYEMSVKNCGLVFPDFDARFRYPGKSGQTIMFRELGAPHPETWIFRSTSEYRLHKSTKGLPPGMEYPCVFKFDWGGEGDNIALMQNQAELAETIDAAERYEKTGQQGFLLQQYIESCSRALRVVIIGSRLISYWKKQGARDEIRAGVSRGAGIDHESDPLLQQKGKEAVQSLCAKTGINLAGFDLLFPGAQDTCRPLFLEINYFFGRRGLGGSMNFYSILANEILAWIDRSGLERPESRVYQAEKND